MVLILRSWNWTGHAAWIKKAGTVLGNGDRAARNELPEWVFCGLVSVLIKGRKGFFHHDIVISCGGIPQALIQWVSGRISPAYSNRSLPLNLEVQTDWKSTLTQDMLWHREYYFAFNRKLIPSIGWRLLITSVCLLTPLIFDVSLVTLSD
jgi:hypothetical protein